MAQAQAADENKALTDILRVISSSPGDLQLVFDTILSHARRLCGGSAAVLWQYDGTQLRLAARNGGSKEGEAYLRNHPLALGKYNPTPQAALEKRTVHVLDVFADRKYRPLVPKDSFRSLPNATTVLAVPLLRQDDLFGVISIWRFERQLFTRQQVAMVEAFASQAAMAIHNVRLHNEIRAALEQQTASGEILRVISSSPTDLRPVFDAILESATRLCDAHLGVLNLFEGEMCRTVAQRGGSPDFAKWVLERGAFKPAAAMARVLAERRPFHVPDAREGPGFKLRNENAMKFVELGGVRTYLAVPLLKEGAVIGSINIYRPEIRPFTVKQIALVSSFANQAVIAIENVRLFNELKTSNSTLREALDQQTATAEILKVISGSPTDVQPVFDAIVRNAVKLCDAMFANAFRYDGERLHFLATTSTHPAVLDVIRNVYPMRPDRSQISGRAILGKSVAHMEDAFADPEYDRRHSMAGGWRKMLGVPLLREGSPIGVIVVGWEQAGPISPVHEQLLKTFADQAVIAVENVRLFNETKEALEQQTAISEVLRVISNSPTDVKPVLDAVAARAANICDATDARIFLAEGDQYKHAAGFGNVGVVAEVIPLNRETPSGRAMIDRAPIHVHDIAAVSDFSLGREIAGRLGWRTILSVPLLREDRALGTIVLRRKEVRPFNEKQIVLLKTFADQAAIAIENARLFSELMTSNSSLRAALDQQTATSDILKVISRSPTDVQPVFDTIIRDAVRLGGADVGTFFRLENGMLHVGAHYNVDPAVAAEFQAGFPQPLSRDSRFGRAIMDRAVVNTADFDDFSDAAKERARLLRIQAAVAVPLLRNDVPIGAIAIGRRTPNVFSDSYVALLKTFADQAVIAIENVRLFNELRSTNASLREALEQQTATSELLKVIGRSNFDLQPVFETLVENAVRLCGAERGFVFRFDGQVLRYTVGHNVSPELREFFERNPITPGRNSNAGRAALERRTVHNHDVLSDPEYSYGGVRVDPYRTVLAVPMFRADELLGVIVIYRHEVRPFADDQIALIETFADQAAIAIENVRLFNETKEALERQTATSEILRVISDSPTNVQPVFDAIARSAVTLCEGLFGVVFRYDGEYAHFAAHYGFSAQALALMQRRYPRVPQGLIAPTLLDSAVSHSPDTLSDPRTANPELHRALGVRGFLSVPMLFDARPIGAIGVFRRDPGPFTDAQIALLRTFADQAVIAIENVRLFNETKESLEQQTAISEVLRVISGSPIDVQPVLDAVAVRAARICEASDARIFLVEGGALRHVAGFGDLPTSIKLGDSLPLTRDSVVGRATIDRAPLHVEDFNALPAEEFPVSRKIQARSGWRTNLCVPLLREDRALGVIALRRMQVRPFTGKQIELVKTFADQAAIAIENVRLFNATKEALERQTATAEILNVISSTPTDVQPVFDVIVRSALRLLEGHSAVVTRIEGDIEHLGAYTSTSPSGDGRVRSMYPRSVSRSGGAGTRAIATGKPNMIADYESDPTLPETVRETARLRGYRSSLVVPMLREGMVVGTVRVSRKMAGPFPDHHIRLLQTFANQAVIAIENVRLFNETREALERQTATADVLKVISKSPADLQPVLDAVAERAARLSGVKHSSVFLAHGDRLRRVAVSGVTSGSEELPIRSTLVNGRAFVERRTVHVPDIVPVLDSEYPDARENQRQMGFRSMLSVPMLRRGEAIGTIGVYRLDVRPFSNEEIGLLETFADQAVIAIENTRLFNETKEALERQTATAEILAVISSNPTDTTPVFDAIVQSALRLFEGLGVGIALREGNEIRIVAEGGGVFRPDPGKVQPLDRESVAGRVIADCQVVSIQDTEAADAPRRTQERARELGIRAIAGAPMRRAGVAIGSLAVMRKEPGALSDKQLQLLQAFADQAVIALENARLFNETTEALERQTATAEILKVIAGSPSDVQPVFDAIAASARQLIGGLSAAVLRVIGDEVHLAAFTTTSESADDSLRTIFPVPISGPRSSARAIRTRAPVFVSDTESGETSAELREVARARGFRSMVAVPMIREGVAIGAINVTRRDPGPFTDHQVNLLKTFADQAVIAIENVRLFKELQERTEALTKSVGQLTALGEVGQAISSTLDLETVLKTIVSRAVQLTRLDAGAIYEYDEPTEQFYLRAAENIGEDVLEILRNTPIRKGDGAVGGTAVAREPIQVSETQDESYKSQFRDLIIRTGRRALLAVPLMREDHIVGALVVQRNTPGPFAPEVVDLLKTFATQSALAIQNARLFREIAEKSRQLEVASQHKSQFLASMSHELRTPLNALLGFNEMILGDVYGEVPGDMKPPLVQMQASGKHLLRLINNVLDLAKIEAGRMELALSDYSVHDTVESVRSALRPLAADKGLELLAAVPEDIPLAYGDPGRITQCLMNLAGNALKFTKAGKVEISVALDDRRLRYSVADTGIGIPADKMESLFTEFKQTDATIASEYGGTGLGLSITKKFVEMHGGRIWVESEPGRGSTFSFEIPLRAQEAKAA